MAEPQITYFHVNATTTLLCEPGRLLRLRWRVLGAIEVTLRRVSAAGPTFSGSTSTVVDSVGQIIVGPVAGDEPHVIVYDLTARTKSGKSRAVVTICVSKAPKLRIRRIEVTQSIQTEEHTCPLVQFKDTVVRVYLQHGLGQFNGGLLPGVSGTIRVRRKGGEWSDWLHPINGTNPPYENPAATISVPAEVDRAVTDHTLNFLLPSWGLDAGGIDLQCRATVTDFGPGGDSLGYSATHTASFLGRPPTITAPVGKYWFFKTKPIAVRYVRLTYKGSSLTGVEAEALLASSEMRLPARFSSIAPLGSSAFATASIDAEITQIQASIDQQNESGSNVEMTPSEIYNGAVGNLKAQYASMQALLQIASFLGIELGIPGLPSSNSMAYWALLSDGRASGGSPGSARAIPSQLFYAIDSVRTITHEFGHCFDQVHLRADPGADCGSVAGSGDSPSDWPDWGRVKDIPFEVWINSTVAPLNSEECALWDLMSYANRRWISPRRWRAIFFYLN